MDQFQRDQNFILVKAIEKKKKKKKKKFLIIEKKDKFLFPK